jgi:3-methyladenine DNA glycosylase AlkC
MAELMKNLYNEEYIKLLSKNIQESYKDFEYVKFTKTVFNSSWNDLELKQRIRHISISLNSYLPEQYTKAIEILKETFSKMNNTKMGLENMIFQDFVEVFGLNDWDESLDALEHFTINCSSEFAIRQFILQDEEKAMQKMLLWAHSPNEQIRRLSSEGCRPRLPWAVALSRFKKDPSKVLEILEILKDDTSKYVQKSVANNINDISKDNEKIVLDLVKSWIGFSKERDWILKHGSRTLLKASQSETLTLFGYEKPDSLKIENFTCDERVKNEQDVNFSFEIQSQKNIDKLRIEYKIYFLRANNKHNAKVFKISEAENFIGTKIIDKKYSFKPISTRRYYLGTHKISIMINGVVLQECSFELVK